MDGRLESRGDKWVLRFERKLDHPPEKVWSALTDPKHLITWFPTTIEGDMTPGAPLRFSFPGGAYPAIEGEMLTYDPLSVLEFKWGGGDVLRFTLRPEGAGTVLTLENTFDQVGKAARDAAGWHATFDQLEAHMGDGAPPSDPNQRWRDLFARYGERFGEEASAVGPPEGHPVTEQA